MGTGKREKKGGGRGCRTADKNADQSEFGEDDGDDYADGGSAHSAKRSLQLQRSHASASRPALAYFGS